jgi:hypothetical protein
MVTKQPVKEHLLFNAGFGQFSLIRLTDRSRGALSKNGKISYVLMQAYITRERAFQFGRLFAILFALS